MPDLPTAQQIARAIVLSAQITGEDPEKVFGSTAPAKARGIALTCLAEAYPHADPCVLARLINYGKPQNAKAFLAAARRWCQWREFWVDEIVGAIVTDEYGERAL